MPEEPTFNGVMARLREALSLRSETAVAGALSLSPQALSNRKRSGSIPYDELIKLAASRNIDIAWLFGFGGANKRGVSEGPGQAIDHQLLADIIHEIDLEFGGVNLGYADTEETLIESGALAYFSAVIYSKTATVSYGQAALEQSRLVRRYAQTLFTLVYGTSRREVRGGSCFPDFAADRLSGRTEEERQLVALIEQAARLDWETGRVNWLRGAMEDLERRKALGDVLELRPWEKHRVEQVAQIRLELLWHVRKEISLDKDFFGSLNLAAALQRLKEQVKDRFRLLRQDVDTLTDMAVLREGERAKKAIAALRRELLKGASKNGVLTLIRDAVGSIDKYYESDIALAPGGAAARKVRGEVGAKKTDDPIGALRQLFTHLGALADRR